MFFKLYFYIPHRCLEVLSKEKVAGHGLC